MVHREWSESSRQPAYPGKVATLIRRMRLVPATKREEIMGDRKLLFLTNVEQANALARLIQAANRGDGGSACRLGDMYREALDGLRYSPKQAFRWYARSAMAGYAHGQNNLGACYEHGLGCAQSYLKAVKWYRLSAEQKLGTASMNLGYCHLRGHGVAADKGEALRLLRLAVEQGEPKAQPEVERLESGVTYGRIPKGFTDRTKDGGSLALIGGASPSHATPEAEKRSRVRYVDVTVPGRNFGIVGVVGVTPPMSKDAASGKRPWTAEDQYRADLGAWEKDDCFDLPDPESDYGKRIKAEADAAIERLIREGRIPRLPDKSGS